MSTRSLTIVLFHSALGLRPGVLTWADRLRAEGFVVHTPDLYVDGRTFDDPESGMAHVESFGGIPALMQRTQESVADLPADVVYAGFSNGGGSAELLAATRPGARGAVLMHAAMPPAAIGVDRWPAGVPVQVHYAERDPHRDQQAVDGLAEAVRASGASFELHEYPVATHLFADPDSPDYGAASAERMYVRVLEFLRRLSARA